MSKAWQTVHTIRPATTDLRMRLGFVVFTRGPLRAQVAALEDLWSRLQAGLLRKRRAAIVQPARHHGEVCLKRWRCQLKTSAWGAAFSQPGPELAGEGVDGRAGRGIPLQLCDLAPVRGWSGSAIRVLFADDTSMQRLPLWVSGQLTLLFWWVRGCGSTTQGNDVHSPAHGGAWQPLLGRQIQAIPKRSGTGSCGMPGVSWLTLIGDALHDPEADRRPRTPSARRGVVLSEVDIGGSCGAKALWRHQCRGGSDAICASRVDQSHRGDRAWR
jgi:hypothetical protein